MTGQHGPEDLLSDLIGLSGLRGSLDLRCQMAGPYMVDHAASPPGEAVFHIILKGGCRIETASRTLIAGAGDLVLLPAGAAHRLICQSKRLGSGTWSRRGPPLRPPDPGDEAAELDVLCGEFHYALTAGGLLFDSLPEAILIEHDALPQSFAPLIRAEADQARPGASGVITALTTAMVILALRRELGGLRLDRGMLALLSDRQLGAALAAMLRHPEKPWTSAALAERVAMSRASFIRRFTNAAGRGPADMLLDIRLHVAMRLLQETGLSHAEIIEQVGYRSVAAFARVFRRRSGMTMAQARNAPTIAPPIAPPSAAE